MVAICNPGGGQVNRMRLILDQIFECMRMVEDPPHSLDLAAIKGADGGYIKLNLLFGALCEVHWCVLDLLRPSCAHFWQLYFFEFWTDFPTFLTHSQVWSRIQLIRLTWPPPRLHMAAIYRCIYSLGDFRKSLDTFWTCSDLPVVISDNFNFSSFKLIFTDSSTFIEVDTCFLRQRSARKIFRCLNES